MRISDEMYKLVGERLKAIRKEKGISLQELEGRVGGLKKKRSLAKYESGEDHPDYATLELICDALEVDVDKVCDFVPVVRCRDCKSFVMMSDVNGSEIIEIPFCFLREIETEENGYCHMGVRK